MPVDGGVRNNPLTITPHAPARKPKMMQQGPVWLHVCVCPTSPEVRQWRSTFFLGVAGLRVSSPRRRKRSDRKLPELPVQELAYILPREHGALLAGAARIRVATEAIGPTGGCRAARGGRQLKRAAPKGRPRDGDHEAGSSSRWKAPARAHRVLKLQRRGGLAHCCA